MLSLGGAGIVYFQELLAEAGSPSTVYFNGITAGSTVAGVLWGAVVVNAGYGVRSSRVWP